MTTRTNLKHRIKARRVTALRNLKRRLDIAKYWAPVANTDQAKKWAERKLEKATLEAETLEARIGSYS
jgi:hypothetical protein